MGAELASREDEQYLLAHALSGSMAELFPHLTDGHFTGPERRALWEAACEVYLRGDEVSIATVAPVLQAKLGLGTYKYLSTLAGLVPYCVDGAWRPHLEAVRDALTRRKLAAALANALEELPRAKRAPALIDRLLADLSRLGEMSHPMPDPLAPAHFAEVAEQGMRQAAGEHGMLGLATGIPRLDRATKGIRPGELWILAAQTGRGKTAAALQIAQHVGLDQGVPVLYLNTEMTVESLGARIVAHRSGMTLDDVETRRFRTMSAADGAATVHAAWQGFARGQLWITPPLVDLTRASVHGYMERARRALGVRLVVLDYVGRLVDVADAEDEWRLLHQVARELKAYASRHRISVLCLSQLTADGQLQGSRRMANDADVVLELAPIDLEQRQDKRMWDRLRLANGAANTWLHVKKARQGRTGSVPMQFRAETMRLLEVASDEVV